MSAHPNSQSEPELRLLQNDDVEWLKNIGSAALNEGSLPVLNELLAVGSIRLHHYHADKERVLEARRKFFEKLGWDVEDHRLNGSYLRMSKLPPLDLAVEAIRMMSHTGRDPAAIINADPEVLLHSRPWLAKKLKFLFESDDGRLVLG